MSAHSCILHSLLVLIAQSIAQAIALSVSVYAVGSEEALPLEGGQLCAAAVDHRRRAHTEADPVGEWDGRGRRTPGLLFELLSLICFRNTLILHL